MSEPIYYHYRCGYPLCHAIHAEPDQAAACHGEEAESVYQCALCEKAHERQREAEDCCDRHREPLRRLAEKLCVIAFKASRIRSLQR